MKSWYRPVRLILKRYEAERNFNESIFGMEENLNGNCIIFGLI